MGNRKNDFVIHRVSYYESQLCRIPVSVDEQHMRGRLGENGKLPQGCERSLLKKKNCE